jgi:hypothetical protein
MASRLLTTLVLGLSLAVLPLAEQQPHSPPLETAALRLRLMRRVPRVAVEVPTVVAFGVLSGGAADSLSAESHAMVERLNFRFVVTFARRPIIVDSRHHAIYYVPFDVSAGYVLIVPGRRSDLVRGLVTPAVLEARLRAYLAPIRPLSLAPE